MFKNTWRAQKNRTRGNSEDRRWEETAMQEEEPWGCNLCECILAESEGILIDSLNTGDERYTDAMKQHKLLNRLKKDELTWMYNFSKCVPQKALRDLDRAFDKYFWDRNKWGYPRFK